MSAISTVGNTYAQNAKDLKEYYYRLDNHLPCSKIGLSLTVDDLIRRDVISSLMCNLVVVKQAIESKHHIKFDEYFASALDNLAEMKQDGLIEITSEYIRVSESARIYIRAICARFDAYLNRSETLSSYSRAI